MMPLFDASAETLKSKADECGFQEYGQLQTPLTGYRLTTDVPFAIDNGSFTRFDKDAFFSLLKKCSPFRDRCLWVAVPDVVGSARRTFEIFELYKRELQSWPLALVAQDGIENLEIPWYHIKAVFIGGTDRFKSSKEAEHVVRAAKILGKLVHVGRVNGPDRLQRFDEFEADTFDGTGILKYPHMRYNLHRRKSSQHLFEEEKRGE